MKISNKDFRLLLKNQEDILKIMHENQILLNRLEEYFRLSLVHNLVNDYENIISKHDTNDEYRKILTKKLIIILKNRLYILQKPKSCY